MYEFTVPPDFARETFSDVIVRDGDMAALIRVPGSDPRLKMISAVHDQWKRSGCVGQPGFWSWRVVRKYTDIEISKTQWFSFNIEKIIELSSSELALLSTESEMELPSRRTAPNLDKYGVESLARSLSGDIIISHGLYQILERYCSEEVVCRKIEHEGLVALYYMKVRNDYAVVAPPTTVGDDPFSAQYASYKDYSFALSEIYFEMPRSNFYKNIVLTTQKSGYEMGDVKKARTVIVSSMLLREIIALSSAELNFGRSHWLI